jgi:hypothetical protein
MNHELLKGRIVLKHLELSDPDSCLNKAAVDEPIFVLRANDVVAMATVLAWTNFRIENGKSTHASPEIVEAMTWVNQVAEWRDRNGCVPA